MRPIELTPNRPRHFYRGGTRIEEFRGIRSAEEHRPEDWLASTTAMFGRGSDGLTRLADGRFLRDAVTQDPEAWLGAGHAARFGSDTALLVKLLDAGERLPVHCHPGQPFARRHLGCVHGKTEAWIVLETAGDEAVVYLGFREEVPAATLAHWVATQDRAAMVRALNVVAVEPGDAVLVPATVPHAIGAGVFVVELQEPSDFSIMLERAGFELGEGATPNLGLGDELALECVDRTSWSDERLSEVWVRRRPMQAGVVSLLPHEAAPFFRAERWQIDVTQELEPAYAVLVGLGGSGVLRTSGEGDVRLSRGATILVPFSSGPTVLAGALELLRCLPPAPDSIAVRAT